MRSRRSWSDVGGRRPVSKWLAILVCMLWALVAAGPATAQTSYVWSGAASATSAWSAAANWSGGVAPAGSVGTLDFPELACGAGSACYSSDDDLDGLTAAAVSIDDGAPYSISGEGITLGSGGITADAQPGATGSAVVAVPIALADPQTWMLSGNGNGSAGLLISRDISGPSDDLNVQFGSRGMLSLSGDTEVGTLSAVGSEPAESGVNAWGNGALVLDGSGRLNAGDDHPVNVTDAALVAGGRGQTAVSVGPLSSRGGLISVGSVLTVNGDVSLDPASETQVSIYNAGDAAGDAGQLDASGSVSVNGTLVVADPFFGSGVQQCVLPLGGAVTMISAATSLSGRYSNAPEGSIIPMQLGCTGSYAAQINYTPHTVTATIAGTTTQLTANRAEVTTNQKVTLTATLAAYPATAGTVQFAGVEGAGTPHALAGCTDQSITASTSGTTIGCTTSFAAGSPPSALTATFTPQAGSGLAASSELVPTPVISAARTSTMVRAASRGGPGGSVTYVATVRPGSTGPVTPSGSVSFADHGSPIQGCRSDALQRHGSLSRATCRVDDPSPGLHLITASYRGEASFAGSQSSAASLAVISAATGPVTGVTTTHGRLAGTIHRFGRPVRWRFTFGDERGHAATTPWRTLRGAGSTRRVSWHLRRLVPGRRYETRLIIATAGAPRVPTVNIDAPGRTFRTKGRR